MIVSVAPTTVAAPIQTVLATEYAGQPEGETAQSSDSFDVEYTQFKISPRTSAPSTTDPTPPQDP